jgi:hypothetical protein
VAAVAVEAADATDLDTADCSHCCFMELPVSESTAELSEAQRREIFLALVQAQDQGASVPVSRQQTAARFGISPDAVVEIEREGMNNEWPPL